MSHQSVTAESPTKLTTSSARTLEPPSGKTDYIKWDEDFPGFGVRVRVGRNRISRNWIYQYDIAGRTRRMTLGNVNAITIQDAHKTAGQLQGKVRLGGDPVREIAENQACMAHTFASVMKTYLTMAKVAQRASTFEKTERYLKVFCKSLHLLPFTAITRRDIAAVLTPIAARGKRMLSNCVRAKLRAFFNWAIKQGLTENNPVNGTEKHKGKARDRVLSLPELTAIWHAVNTADYTAIIRLLMLTGCRRMEIGGLRWGEVRDGETFIDEGLTIAGPAIVLPPERVKNGCKHIVPLSKPAQTILLTHPHRPDDDFVFRQIAAGNWDLVKKSFDAALIKRGHNLAPWVLHDLRRSVSAPACWKRLGPEARCRSGDAMTRAERSPFASQALASRPSILRTRG